MEFHRDIEVSWGHCDAAGIVYYPRFLDWFDECYQAMLRTAGWDQRKLRERWGILGTGVVDVSARFARPVSFSDVLRATSAMERWSGRSFTVLHRFHHCGELAVEGREVRVWLEPKAGADSAITAGRIPEEFKRSLGWTPGEEAR